MTVTHVIGPVRAIKNHVLVQDMNFGERKSRGGIIILGDDGVDRGIRARWAKVYSVGPLQDEIVPGQWILVEHGRWTRGIDVTDNGVDLTIRRVDVKDILLISDTEPGIDETIRS